jgi:4-hydroxy-3-polyprenylbenzoate decarboxylase
MRKLIVGITGASGSVYAVRLVQTLVAHPVEIHLIISELGTQVLAHELNVTKDDVPAIFTGMNEQAGNRGKVTMHWIHDMFAPVASGSFQAESMVVIPCSMKTLSAVANGYTSSLLERAADVILKERKPLILVTRESPLSRVHLTNMLRAHEAGATIMPASPGFYHHPGTIDDLVGFVVARVLDHLKIDHPNPLRWGSDG